MSAPLYTLRWFKLAFATARLLPRSLAGPLATRVGWASFRQQPAARAALWENLRRVSGLENSALEKLCRENVANFSRMLADYFLCAGMDAPTRAKGLVEAWSGYEHLLAARARGRGTLIVTAHLGHWELGGLLLTQRGLPLTVVTLEEPSTELTRWREAARRHARIQTITVGPAHPFAFVEMIKVLRRNELLAMLVDRPYAGNGASVDFFGARAEFSTAPALLAHHTGATVLPAFVLQTSGNRYTSFADPAIPMSDSEDRQQALRKNTQRIASRFEMIIRKYPEQWFNYVPIWPPEPAVVASSALS